MKKTRFCILLAALLLASTPVFAGPIADRVFNGGAKSLAKQVQNLNKKAAELEEKAAGIEEKVLALSDRDRRAYQAELERLGFVPPAGLFNDPQALLTGAPEAPEGGGGIAGLIGGIFGGGGSSSSGASSGGGGTTTQPATAPTTTESGSGGTFTLTGIPSQYNGKYAMSSGGNTAGTINVVGAQTLTLLEQGISATFVPIRNGRAVLNLYVGTIGRLNRYTGSDTIDIGVIISDQASVGNVLDFDFNMEVIVGFENVSFRNGSATMAWSAGEVEEGVSSSAAPGIFTLTGIPSQYNGKYVMFQSRDAAIIGAQAFVNVEGEYNGTLTPIRNGRAAMNLWRVSPAGFAPYKGTDTVKATVMIYNQATVKDSDSSTEEISVEFASVSFRNGDATQAWSTGTVVEAPPPGRTTGVTAARESAKSTSILVGWNAVEGATGYIVYYSATGTDSDAAREGSPTATTFTSTRKSTEEVHYFKVSAVNSGGEGTPSAWVRVEAANPTTWTAVDATGAFGTRDNSIYAIAFGNNRFVATGQRGRMAYSADGVSWTAVANSGFPSHSLSDIRAIAFGNNRFVAVGETGGMAYSEDGETWTAVAAGTSRNPGQSTFGITSISDIAWGNNRFVAVGGDGKMAYSADGASWTAIPPGTDAGQSSFGNEGIAIIVYANNRFVAVNFGSKIAYSTDGARWTAVENSGFGSSRINAIAWGNNRFVAVGREGKMAYSADGVSWTAVDATGAFGTRDNSIQAIAFGNNRWVAGGEINKMAYSVDGVNWTAVANSGFGRFYIDDIVYANSRFIAVGGGGRMAYADW